MAKVILDKERNFTLSQETMTRINEKYGSIEAAVEELRQLNLHAFITIVWALLAEDDPDLNFEDTARLLYANPENMKQVDAAITMAFTEKIVP
ncbi:hypothetical protein [Desulfallas thermosapovorans]|uniref:Uncharacterized protein n=1 Tax=Desulfallas thermosapovorans DSM 6562 TaxID=1121431 RepID=A0A5S4ZR31_9FIRM|nr:hypothetical protein [Desulfallas thermosapovorans]TYO95284.1 hypothetical protein LX24_01633 [Desulfallas thermosapovorans DSM 6562]